MVLGLKPRVWSTSVATASNELCTGGTEELTFSVPGKCAFSPAAKLSIGAFALVDVAELGGRGGTAGAGMEPATEGVSGVGGFGVLGETGGKILAKNSAGLLAGLRGLRPMGLLPLGVLLRTSSEGYGL